MVTARRSGLFGPRVSRHFGFTRSAVLKAGAQQTTPIAMTYLVSEQLRREPTPTAPVEAAFSIMVQLAPLEWHGMTLDTTPHFSGFVPAGAVSVVDLESKPRSQMKGRFEAVQFYVPRASLDALCRDHGLARIGRMSRPRAAPDPAAWRMATLLLPHIQGRADTSPLFVDHLATAFLAHAARHYGGVDFDAGLAARGSLSLSQQKRVEAFMRASLDEALTIDALADAVEMRPRPFAAAFRKSFGMPPYRYLLRLRIEEAKLLLAVSHAPLADIALRCGFSDQSHFNRAFSRAVGAAPGAWRRMRAA